MSAQVKMRMYAPTDDQSKLKLVKISASSATKPIVMSDRMYTLQTHNDWWQWRSKQQMQCWLDYTVQPICEAVSRLLYSTFGKEQIYKISQDTLWHKRVVC